MGCIYTGSRFFLFFVIMFFNHYTFLSRLLTMPNISVRPTYTLFFVSILVGGVFFWWAAWLGYVYLAKQLEGGGSFEVDVCIHL